MDKCPCGSENQYDACCGQYISGATAAPTAEALMRSRYCAYVMVEIDYLEKTLLPRTRKDFDRNSAESWARSSTWQGLEIVQTTGGKEDDSEGTVEFIATFSAEGEDRTHHETSRFQKQDGTWYFVDGRMASATVRRQGPKIGRNDPCPCGSGKKYKKCCGRN